jgi:hypothetical protein
MRIILPPFGRILALVIAASVPSLASATPQPAVLTFESNTVSGSLDILFDHETQTIVEITSIALTIDHQKFKLKDVDFGFPPANIGDYTIIGGVKNGIEQVLAGTRDFLLLWDPSANAAYFAYSRPGMKSTVNEFAVVTITADGLAALPRNLSDFAIVVEAYGASPAAFIPSRQFANHVAITGGTTRRRLGRVAIS